MTRRPDSIARLAESIGCELAEVAPSKRRDWVDRGLLAQPRTEARLSERDVIDITLIRLLHETLKARDANIVWEQLRSQLDDRLPTGDLYLVVDAVYRSAELHTRDTLIAAVRTGRLVRVIPLGPTVELVRQAFRRLVAEPKKSPKPGAKAGRRAS